MSGAMGMYGGAPTDLSDPHHPFHRLSLRRQMGQQQAEIEAPNPMAAPPPAQPQMPMISAAPPAAQSAMPTMSRETLNSLAKMLQGGGNTASMNSMMSAPAASGPDYGGLY